MAKTADDKKKVYVHSHTKDDGTKVKTHYRSTPNTSTGKKSKWLCWENHSPESCVAAQLGTLK